MLRHIVALHARRNIFVLFNLFALRNRNWDNASNACKEMEQW